MLDSHELLSATLNWSCSLSGCLLLDGCVEISSPARKFVPQKLLLACDVATIEYSAFSDASSADLSLKYPFEGNCPFGFSSRKSLHDTVVHAISATPTDIHIYLPKPFIVFTPLSI